MMRPIKKIVFSVIMFLTATSCASAATYYVAKTGSDSYSCAQAQSLSAPKLTILAGIGCMTGGDTLTIKAGTYTDLISEISKGSPIIPAGSASAYTTIQAANGETVLIEPLDGGNYNAAFSIRNNQYLKFIGLTIDGSNMPGGVDQYAGNNIIVGGNAHDIIFDKCEMRNGQSGVFETWDPLDVYNITVRNSSLHTVLVSSRYNHVLYNSARNSLFENNDIYGSPGGWCIQQYWSGGSGLNNNIYRNNRIHDCVDGGVMINVGDNNLVANNLIYNNTSYSAVHLAWGGTGNQVFNNTMVGNGGNCVSGNNHDTNSIIKNNICWQNANNIIDDAAIGIGNVISNNLFTDPKFVSATDFHLQAGSAAIDAGANLSSVGITTDFEGKSRPQGSGYDIGAYEYGGTVAPPPPGAPLPVAAASWNLDEGSGQTIVDRVAANHGFLGLSTAAESSDPARVLGKYGSALSFDGVDDVATVPLTTSTQNLSSFTYSAWIKPNSLGEASYGRIVSRESSVKYDDFYLLVNPGNTISASITNSAGTTFISYAVASSISLNAWNHVAVTYDDKGDRKLHLFVNGVETTYQAQPPVTGTLKFTNNPILIGNTPSLDRTFDGAIDEVNVYNRALSASEISNVFNSPPYSIIDTWNFDESSGQTISSSNGSNNGILGFNNTVESFDPARLAIGKFGAALSFDGVDDIATIPLTTSTQNLSSFTYSAWIKPNSLGEASYGRIVSRESSAKFDDFYFLVNPGNTLCASVTNSAGTTFISVSATSAISLNSWNHVAVTYDDKGDRQLHLFVNGVETAYQSQNPLTGTLKFTTNPIVIGNAPSLDRTFDGAIDDLRLYSRALSAAEIQSLYSTPIQVAAPTMSPNGGTFTAPVSVTLSAPVGASIYYTTNGSTPTTSSSLYTAPMTLSSTTTLKAIAVKNGMLNSTVASASFTINLPPTTIVLSAAPILTWSTTNATSCTASGSWTGTEPLSGTASLGSVSTTASYVLTCTGPAGTKQGRATLTIDYP